MKPIITILCLLLITLFSLGDKPDTGGGDFSSVTITRADALTNLNISSR